MEALSLRITVGGGVIETDEVNVCRALPAGRYTGVIVIDGETVPTVIFTRPTYLAASVHSSACETTDGVRGCSC